VNDVLSAERILARRRALFSDPKALDTLSILHALRRSAMQPHNDETINELPLLGSASTTDLVPIWHNGQTYQIPVSALNAAPSSITFYNVVAFGADPTGVAASDTAINSAVSTAVAAGGGIVFFPPGRYRTTNSILINGSVLIMGSGRNATNILWSTTSAPCFNVVHTAGAVAGRLFDLTISAQAVATAPAILLGQPYDYTISNIVITGGVPLAWNSTSAIQIGAVVSDTAVDVYLEDVLISACANGIDWVAGNGGGLYVNNVVISGAQLVGSWGYRFTGAMVNVETTSFSGGGIGNFNYGIIFTPSAGFVQSGFITNYLFDACGVSGVLMSPSGTGAVQRWKFSECWITGGSGASFVAGTGGMTGTVVDLAIMGCNIMGSTVSGLFVGGGAAAVKLSHCKLYENATQVDLALCSDVTIENNHAMGLYLGAGSGGFNVNGIRVASTATTFQIKNNNTVQNTNPIVDNSAPGVDQIISGNIGYNPLGLAASPPAVPSSGTGQINIYNEDAMVYLAAGSATGVSATVKGRTGLTSAAIPVANSTTVGILVPARATITPTYTGGPPTWTWVLN
jgi:hypothetical protein